MRTATCLITMKIIQLFSLPFLVLFAFALAGCQATRAVYESAPYKVARSDGKFEVRDYPRLTVVQTPMTADKPEEGDRSFSRLFRYISGGNEAKQNIAMTTPVFVAISETNASMAFMMPTNIKVADAPKPSEDSVVVYELPAGRFAVLRFSGGRNARNEATALARLKTWMKQENLVASALPVFAYFDPPWTPAFLRHNEVMIRMENKN